MNTLAFLMKRSAPIVTAAKGRTFASASAPAARPFIPVRSVWRKI
jgi:hypothetical protein